MITPEREQEEISRIRIPKKGELLGIATAMLGAGKVNVECDDGKIRICRIPGKIVKRVWINPGDLILIEPWKVQSNERGDIKWRYTRTQVAWLKRKGYIKRLNIE
jgi:translation initiation factor 1A